MKQSPAFFAGFFIYYISDLSEIKVDYYVNTKNFSYIFDPDNISAHDNPKGEALLVTANEEFIVGNYKSEFNTSQLSLGMSIYRLSGADVNITKMMLLIK